MGTSVIGAGSWGTALAIQLARAGHAVTLWARDAGHTREMAETRQNQKYLAGYNLPVAISPTSDLEQAVRAGTKLLVCAVPSHAVRETMAMAARFVAPDAAIVSATKGIEEGTALRMSEIIRQTTSCGERVGVLAGPSFAKEVAAEMPTAVTIASAVEDVARFAQKAFATPMFRPYVVRDVVGCEIGGTVKNVIAIAAGVSDGLGLGHNTRAGLITRGLAEVNRLAIHLGADPLTVTGLAGLGDLVLTCTGELSRNRSVGLKLGRGEKLNDVLGGMTQVAEGVRNTLAVDELARSLTIEMPITAQMRCLLFEDKSPREAMVDLMTRSLKSEF
ncbi:MAG TPA: NAD(P)H-dependent glycerol-3-phosphate dehydrogenase [Candidatus Binatia bacterium]|nr:NAD(P)H-dependent glycerol-3-phosphate dehydrogenase [Candidatus Binatia bacterium]